MTITKRKFRGGVQSTRNWCANYEHTRLHIPRYASFWTMIHYSLVIFVITSYILIISLKMLAAYSSFREISWWLIFAGIDFAFFLFFFKTEDVLINQKTEQRFIDWNRFHFEDERKKQFFTSKKFAFFSNKMEGAWGGCSKKIYSFLQHHLIEERNWGIRTC